MKIRVLDTETTGTPEDGGRVCEIGWIDLDRTQLGCELKMESMGGCLVDPGHPMPPIAQAVHHISDSDLAGALKLEEVIDDVMSADIYVAHNAKFEQHFLGGSPWICTFKCACRLYLDAEKHTNQYLRYWLKLDCDDILAQPAHRAAPDAYVTAVLFQRMLSDVVGYGNVAEGEDPLDKMLEWSRSPALLPKVGFGKHGGRRWEEVASTSPDYLQWVLGQDFDEDVRFTAGYWLRGGR